MYKIIITPYFRPRRRYGYWTQEFEIIPSLRVLSRLVTQAREDLTKSMENGTVDTTEENIFLRDAVYPKCLLVIEGAKTVPKPHPRGNLKIHTIIRSEKILGDIALKDLEVS